MHHHSRRVEVSNGFDPYALGIEVPVRVVGTSDEWTRFYGGETHGKTLLF